jgi:thiosulfate/3-mercaptopyruvate sulfurtransferase
MGRSPLVDVAELAQALSGPAPPLVLDVRAAELFCRGHLPSAIHIDLWGVSLIDTDEAPLRAFMWMIGHLFSLRGVVPERPVVVYDTDSGVRAARVFWFLEYLGHSDVRVLDGGFSAWTHARQPATIVAESPTPSTWHGERVPDLVADWRQVRDRVGSPDAVIVDTRSDDEYFGRVARARRGGAIPGAVHLEWTKNLTADGTYLPITELARMYKDAGVTPDREVVSYCQGGYRAAHTYLALRRLGYPRLRNYVGSWKEWGDREDLPIERVVERTEKA